jgi:SAM-dependent methyltransferase
MSDWTDGYVTDIGYTYGYYAELNPQLLKLAFTHAGFHFPQIENACELGFGQGISINIHASASTIVWSGTDFNPAQAGFAQELARHAGNATKLFDESFAQYCTRDDLPDFDYIGLHGIWTWISDENRAVIVNFIKRKLKVGGVLYISYNTQPGWSSMVPLQHLMAEYANALQPLGEPINKRIDGAIAFTDKLFATKPLFTRVNPAVIKDFEKLKLHNRHYLAHEYFNQNWLPMPFSKMAEWLSGAKLQYVCSANYTDQIEVINLTAEQQALLQEITDPIFRQTVRDVMLNTIFRKDYWVKGARSLSPLEKNESLSNQSFMLIKDVTDVSLSIKGAAGEVKLNESIYKPLLEVMSNHKAKSLAQLEPLLKPQGINFPQILQAMMMLIGIGAVATVQDEAVIAKVKKSTDKLNLALMSKSRSSPEISFLASPVLGGGTYVGRFTQLFILGLKEGKRAPQDLAQYVWNILAIQGQKINKDGKTLDTPEDNLAELTEQANRFNQKQAPILKALQII